MNFHFPRIRTVNRSSESKLTDILNKEGYHLLKLNGRNILNEKTFFQEIVQQGIPLDPPLNGNANYDAFNDSLLAGISKLPKAKVALLWTDFNNILDKGLNDFLKISECLYQIAEDLTHTEYGIEREVELKVFLLGEGANFSNL